MSKIHEVVEDNPISVSKNKELVTNKFIEAAQGTCMNSDEVINFINEFDDDLDFEISEDMLEWDIINDQIFVCGECGWWCEVGDWIDESHPKFEMTNDICTSCGEE